MVLFHSTPIVEASSGYPFFTLVFVLPERETLMLSVSSSHPLSCFSLLLLLLLPLALGMDSCASARKTC